MKRINIGSLVPSTEAIDFQTDDFAKEIEFAFNSMLENCSDSKEAQESKECKNIQKLIFTRTGINVVLVLETDILAGVHVPEFHKNHIFIENQQRDIWKKHRDLSSNKTNYANFIKSITQTTVDLKNAKVTGVFSELSYPVFMNFTFFRKFKFPAQQLTAALLHELGHIFSMFEMISRTNTTNQVLAYISKSVIERLDSSEKKVIFKQSEELLGLEEGALKNSYDQTDINVLTVDIMNKSYKGSSSQTNSYGYDLLAVDQMADQFCNRFGYGRHAIEFNDRLKKEFTLDYQTKSNYNKFLFVDVSTNLVMKPLLIFLGLASGALLFNVLSVYLIYGLTKDFIFAGAANEVHSYDTMVTRPTRIRNDLMQAIKNPKLDKETVAFITKDIELMNIMIDSYKDYAPVFSRIKNYLMKSHRDVQSAKELQNDLENLAANKLFLQAAQLKTM